VNHESLNRGVAINLRHDDVAIFRDRLLANDYHVAIRDVGIDHALARYAQCETLPGATKPVLNEYVAEMIFLGKHWLPSGDDAIDRNGYQVCRLVIDVAQYTQASRFLRFALYVTLPPQLIHLLMCAR
jgi:hypothetical protein